MDLIPGFLQGLSKIFITYPVDVVKIKMQTKNYNSIVSCISHLIKNDKTIFVRGIKLPIFIFPAERAISYKIFEDLNKKNYNPYFSGTLSGLIGSITNVPMQYFTTNAINMKKEEYINITTLIKQSFKTKNFYKGYFIETGRICLGSSIFLGTYGNLRKILENKTSFVTPISSIISISTVWLITFPLDTIRVEKQISNDKIIDIIKRRNRNFGGFNLYKGLTPVLFRSIPSTSIGMYVYELARSYFNCSE